MKLKKRVAVLVVVFFSPLLLFPSWSGMGVANQGRYGGVGIAISAEISDNAGEEEEPFEVKQQPVSDPFQRINRFFFAFNDRLYFYFLKPVAIVYAGYVPPGVRKCIRNAFLNFVFPVRFVNSIFQGDFKGSGTEFARFGINSTLGAGGLFDVASTHFSINAIDEDFGQTLGYYGVKPGFYINWPVLGPSTLRDTFGLAGDMFLNPLYYLSPEWYVSAGIRGGLIVNSASLRMGEYEDFKKSALDPYISLRDAYMQNRVKVIEE